MSQKTVTPQKAVPRTNNQQEQQRDETKNKYEEKKMYSGMYSGMTIAMYIRGVIMRMWRNNISCFVLQNTFLRG